MASVSTVQAQSKLEFGRYDGGFERDEQAARGEIVKGKAAELLAMDSSSSKFVLLPQSEARTLMHKGSD